MTEETDLLAVLKSIDRRLALLTGAQEQALRRAILNDLLRTPGRRAMWDAMDGRTGSPELARQAGVSERAAQLFIRELSDLGLVRVVGTSGRGNLFVHDDEAIVRWYLQLGLVDE